MGGVRRNVFAPLRVAFCVKKDQKDEKNKYFAANSLAKNA